MQAEAMREVPGVVPDPVEVRDEANARLAQSG